MSNDRVRVLIMGAAGRDFHDFNTYFRDRDEYEVVAFTATQIPDIEGRSYPAGLAGPNYPDGIPIRGEEELEDLIEEAAIDEVVFSYSDVSHEYVMHRASRVLASGAGFRFLPPEETMLRSSKPVVAVTAVRTGVGKSQTTRRVADILTEMGKRVVVIRHPMPYGDLAAQAVQRFADYSDLDKHECTIEEREEYEPHLDRGLVVYAGVDYEAILRQAEKEADVILWDGGNNDLPFYRPDLHITLVDPHRAGHEMLYHPGEANLRRSDVLLINKVETAPPEGVRAVREAIASANPKALLIDGASPVFVEDPERIRGKRVLVVEDGPTLTHGDMQYGAGVIAAEKYGALEIIDPRPFTVGSITDTFDKYPRIGSVLPAMGYGTAQVADLAATIEAADVDLVVIATPIDLRRLIEFDRPALRVRYELQEIGTPTLKDVLEDRFC
ncbi:MAG: cyclic 2,3-diphosphoglycerate synthase [Clostridia bacterium]